MPVTRRNFLKTAAIAAGAAAATAAVPGMADASAAIPKKWDLEYDVVVIGYGGAGAASAITAHDNKAKVLIIEKMHEGGGNTAVSTGGMMCPDNAEKADIYINKLFDYSKSTRDKDVIKMYAKESMSIVDWVKSLKPGIEMRVYGKATYPHVEGQECMYRWSVSTGSPSAGPNLWAVYTHAVETERKIPVMLNTPAKRLVKNAEGAVIGVIAEKDGKPLNIKAKKGVILACGGYEYNQEMLSNYVKGSPIYALGNPGNTGDGINMAVDVGADLWHMNGLSCPIGMKVPGYKAYTVFTFPTPGYILVDKNARRFIDEKNFEHHAGLLAVDNYDSHKLDYDRIPCFAIFDDKTRAEGGPLNGPSKSGYIRNRENFTWSRDNLKEIEMGLIKKADTIEELAKIIGLKPEALRKTIDKWNSDVAAGEDTMYGRPVVNKAVEEDLGLDPSKAMLKAKVLSAPIVKAPFYAVEIYPTVLNTQGGPKRNAKSQVVNPYGEPIPRLYSAGELGSLWGIVYQGAGNNAESIVTGRIAGMNAAKEKSW